MAGICTAVDGGVGDRNPTSQKTEGSDRSATQQKKGVYLSIDRRYS